MRRLALSLLEKCLLICLSNILYSRLHLTTETSWVHIDSSASIYTKLWNIWFLQRGRSCCVEQRILKPRSLYVLPSFIKDIFLLPQPNRLNYTSKLTRGEMVEIMLEIHMCSRKNSISRTTCKLHPVVFKTTSMRKDKYTYEIDSETLSFSSSSLRNFCSSLSKTYRASPGT